jgi:hypothetical protein
MTNEEMAQVLDFRGRHARTEALRYEDGSYLFRNWIIQAETSESGAAALRAMDRVVSQRAINLARGCFDYQGGYDGDLLHAFHHGVGTVLTCLENAAAGDESYQLRVVDAIGLELPAPPKEDA